MITRSRSWRVGPVRVHWTREWRTLDVTSGPYRVRVLFRSQSWRDKPSPGWFSANYPDGSWTRQLGPLEVWYR